jgi:hypothetical protein
MPDAFQTGREELVNVRFPGFSSIVDSVLADLKPRLMEEVSRKMGKEKKRK